MLCVCWWLARAKLHEDLHKALSEEEPYSNSPPSLSKIVRLSLIKPD